MLSRDRRRRRRATCSSRSAAATSWRPSRPSAAASRCSTPRSPRRSSSASAASRPAATPTSSPQLTPQEQKILVLVAEGKTNKEIAAEVFLSDKTVKNYVSSILSKLNLERRAQAAAFVAKHRARPRRRLTRWGTMEDDLVAWGRVVRIETTGRGRGGRPGRRWGSSSAPAARSSSPPGRAERRLGAQPARDAPRAGSRSARRRGRASADPLAGAEHAAAVRDLILRYGTPSEGLGSGPSFELVREAHCAAFGDRSAWSRPPPLNLGGAVTPATPSQRGAPSGRASGGTTGPGGRCCSRSRRDTCPG